MGRGTKKQNKTCGGLTLRWEGGRSQETHQKNESHKTKFSDTYFRMGRGGSALKFIVFLLLLLLLLLLLFFENSIWQMVDIAVNNAIKEKKKLGSGGGVSIYIYIHKYTHS